MLIKVLIVSNTSNHTAPLPAVGQKETEQEAIALSSPNHVEVGAGEKRASEEEKRASEEEMKLSGEETMLSEEGVLTVVVVVITVPSSMLKQAQHHEVLVVLLILVSVLAKRLVFLPS